MSYEMFRISFQDSELAARAAWKSYCESQAEVNRLREHLAMIQVVASAFPQDKLILKHANEALGGE